MEVNQKNKPYVAPDLEIADLVGAECLALSIESSPWSSEDEWDSEFKD